MANYKDFITLLQNHRILIVTLVGINISNELINIIPSEKIYVDGSDFSGLVQIGGFIGAKILGIIIIFYSIFIDILIWIIYGFVLIIMKIIKRINDRKKVG